VTGWSTFFGNLTMWMRGGVPRDATVPSAFAGAESSARDFPPSNKVPTWFLLVSPDPHDPRSVQKACIRVLEMASTPTVESVEYWGPGRRISAVRPVWTY
jgi:hypothetical protein